MIEIKGLGFTYHDYNPAFRTRGQKRIPDEMYVLRGIDMNLEEGKIYGLLGENGVGKTTLLTLICGLKKQQEGTIITDGHNPYDREPDFLSDQYYLSDEAESVNMTAADYAANYGRFWKNFDMEKFIEIMEHFGTDVQQKMNAMSAGQLKKTYISFALACGTKYLIMDEPTNGLDIPSKAQFRKAMMKYTREDATVIISTHQVRDLENIIDPIIILDRQEVLLNASIEEITQKLYFDYGTEICKDSLYSELVPGGCIQVKVNTTGEDSKLDIEALFNTVHKHKDIIKGMFNNN